MSDINRKFLALGSGLGTFYDANKFKLDQIDIPKARLGNDVTKTKLIKFAALKVTPILAEKDGMQQDPFAVIAYHAASGSEGKDIEQRALELSFLSKKIEELNANGFKRILIPGDFNQSVIKEKSGIEKGKGALSEHFEPDQAKIFDIAKTLMGQNFVLKKVHLSKYIVSKQRIGANIAQSNQAGKGGVPGNPKEIDFDSKTLFFEIEERPADMTPEYAAERAQKIIGELTIPNTPNFVREFGPNAYTDGSDHAPSDPAPLDDAGINTCSMHPLIGTDGIRGFIPTTELYICDLTDEGLLDQHIATIKLQEIVTQKLLNIPQFDSEALEKAKKGLAELHAQQVEHPQTITKYIQFIKSYAHNKEAGFEDYLLKTDENRTLIKEAIRDWVKTSEYHKMASLFKGETAWEECLKDEAKFNDFVMGIKKELFTSISEKMGRQTAAGYKPTKGSPREDQFLSLANDNASLIFVSESGDLSPEIIALKNPKLATGHLNAFSSSRDSAEEYNLRAYFDGFEASEREALGYNKLDIQTKETRKKLADTLKALRTMVLKKALYDLSTESNLGHDLNALLADVNLQQQLFDLAIRKDNAMLACALALHSDLGMNITEQLADLIRNKDTDQFNQAEIALIAGYIGTASPLVKERALDLLFNKIVGERASYAPDTTMFAFHAKLFSELPELAVYCLEKILSGKLDNVNESTAFLKAYPLLLVNLNEVVTKLLNRKNNEAIVNKLTEVVTASPQVQEELNLILLDLENKTAKWAVTVINNNKPKTEAEFKKAAEEQEPIVTVHTASSAGTEAPAILSAELGNLSLTLPSATYLPGKTTKSNSVAGRVAAYNQKIAAMEKANPGQKRWRHSTT